MKTNSIIKCEANGKPWTAVRKINGKSTIVTKILIGDTYIEVPADTVIAMINGKTRMPAAKITDRKAETSRQLLEITQRYRTGDVR